MKMGGFCFFVLFCFSSVSFPFLGVLTPSFFHFLFCLAFGLSIDRSLFSEGGCGGVQTFKSPDLCLIRLLFLPQSHAAGTQLSVRLSPAAAKWSGIIGPAGPQQARG